MTPSTPKPRAGEVCDVCGGRKMACAVLGHRHPGDNTQWQEPRAGEHTKGPFATSEFRLLHYVNEIEAERDALRAIEAELVAALDQLATGMEQIAKAIPEAVAYMPGIKWMPEQARKLLTKHGR